jgi:hypothetical protein
LKTIQDFENSPDQPVGYLLDRHEETPPFLLSKSRFPHHTKLYFPLILSVFPSVSQNKFVFIAYGKQGFIANLSRLHACEKLNFKVILKFSLKN